MSLADAPSPMTTPVVEVDAVIVGGGIQGLVLLRELTAAGYASVLLADAPLGSGQTLHSHGALVPGTGLVTGGLTTAVEAVTVPYLRRLGVLVRDDAPAFLVLPDPMVNELSSVWKTNGYRPRRTDPSAIIGFEPDVTPFCVTARNVDKRRLVESLAHGLEHLILSGELVDADGDVLVVAAGSQNLRLHTGAVVVAAGCGTKALLRDTFGVEGGILDRITYSRMHMVCLRAPPGKLPPIGALVSPALLVIAHQDDGPDGRATWFVTPVDQEGATETEAPRDAVAEVEPRLVDLAIDGLQRFFPALRGDDEQVQATVFAGYKQELDGQPTKRVCEWVNDGRNLMVALPSVLANAIPNAHDAVAILRARVEPRGGAVPVPGGGVVVVGEPDEDRSREWRNWRSFAQHKTSGRAVFSTEEESVDLVGIVQDIYQAFGEGDVPAIMEHLADDVAWEQGDHGHGVPWLQPRHGRADVAGFFEAMDLVRADKFEPVAFLTGDGQVAVIFEVVETVKATNVSIHDTVVHLWTFDDQGRAVAFRHFLDTHKHVLAYRG